MGLGCDGVGVRWSGSGGGVAVGWVVCGARWGGGVGEEAGRQYIVGSMQ